MIVVILSCSTADEVKEHPVVKDTDPPNRSDKKDIVEPKLADERV